MSDMSITQDFNIGDINDVILEAFQSMQPIPDQIAATEAVAIAKWAKKIEELRAENAAKLALIKAIQARLRADNFLAASLVDTIDSVGLRSCRLLCRSYDFNQGYDLWFDDCGAYISRLSSGEKDTEYLIVGRQGQNPMGLMLLKNYFSLDDIAAGVGAFYRLRGRKCPILGP